MGSLTLPQSSLWGSSQGSPRSPILKWPNLPSVPQKTRDFAAFCKQLKEDKLCTLTYLCHKCLLNR